MERNVRATTSFPSRACTCVCFSHAGEKNDFLGGWETQRIYRAAAVGRNGKIFFWQNFESREGEGAKGVMEQLFKRASTHPRSGKGMCALFLLLSPQIEFFFSFFRMKFSNSLLRRDTRIAKIQSAKVEKV